eukprot:c25274_g1_i1 orf=163-1443(+)
MPSSPSSPPAATYSWCLDSSLCRSASMLLSMASGRPGRRRFLIPAATPCASVIAFSSLIFSGLQIIVLTIMAGAVGVILLRLLSPVSAPVSTSEGYSSERLLYPSPSPNVRQLPWLLRDASGKSKGLCRNFSRAEPESDASGILKYYLVAVIFNRVFEEDLFRITSYECKQWIEYMLYAGVDHIFWYDTAHSDAESQHASLDEYVKMGLLTYHRFHHIFPGNIQSGYHFEQDNSYSHFLQNYRHTTKWALQMDVDEYPFSSSDAKSCFLYRRLQHYESTYPNLTQILLQCMIFGGNPQGNLENGWVIERYQRRQRRTVGNVPGSNGRTKPIYQPNFTSGATPFDPHMFRMNGGETVVAESEVIRMNHYWGARLTDFGPDTAAVLEMLVPDTSMQPIASELKQATELVRQLKQEQATELVRQLKQER